MTKPCISDGTSSLTFADELVHIERIGPMTHLSFAAMQRDLMMDEKTLAVVVRLAIPTERIECMARQMLAGEIKSTMAERELLNVSVN